MKTAYISHDDCSLHQMQSWHPESPARLQSIQDQLIASGLMALLARYDAPLVSREQLLRVHTAEHLALLVASSPLADIINLDMDTAMCPDSLQAAYRAAGAVVLATDRVMQGKVANAFCSVRPPGHHATRQRAMGFCLFNNIAVGVAHALEVYKLERVAVIDFDVHHGNGTEDIFKDDTRVMMVSTFQHPLYPYSGVDGRSERMVNIPLAEGSGGKVFRAAVEEYWLPALGAFKPQMLFISAGFDAHRDDDLAGMNLLEDDYAWVTEKIKAVAKEHAEGRIVSALEGGYDLGALGRSVAAHLKILMA
jgi:acetoin utilization deacetylase AcuC-like enzyme